jgi:bifunctional non-homologous end joining protein LigD
MPLEQYKRKRDFTKTPEPAGATDTRGSGRFVVQRHRATRLHYDFRLEVDGVLASWAVPKGPTLDPGVRRMAVHVEDHPIEYFDFEGVIPKGQYGAGDVIVWDWGTYEPEPETSDPLKAIENGELKFTLNGQKLKGRFTIVRTSRRPGQSARPFEDDEGEQWLLIHKRDDASVSGWDAETFPQSVKTGRTNDEVKANRDALWTSHAPAGEAAIHLAAAKPATMPDYIEPMAATLTSKPFRDEDWLFEIKWDGYRVETVLRDGKVRIWTRRGNDAATYFGEFLSRPNWIDAQQAIVDGEVVASDENGTPDFGVLQEKISAIRAGRPASGLVYQVFDLLYLDGKSLLDVPLEDRKRLLKSVLKRSRRVQYASHVDTEGVDFYEAAKKLGVEGVVAKHRRSRYEPGRRTNTWLKIKIRPEQELVVGGYTPGEGNAKDLGAVVVGVYEGRKLKYAGKVGSGFNATTRRELRERLEQLETDKCPYDPCPERKGELRTARWVKPQIVIRADLGGWTREGYVRQTSYKGLDHDKDPKTVVRERPKPAGEAEEAAEAEVEAAEAEAEAEGATATSQPAPRAKPPTATATTRNARGARKAATASSDLPKVATPEELKKLEELGNEGLWEVGGQTLKLTNLNKPLFPGKDEGDPEITKRELIRYFAQIGGALLPHLEDRALNLHRYPGGAFGNGFWQKNIPAEAPKFLRIWHETGVEDREDRAPNDHLVADQVASLAWLANQAAFEFHAWTSKIDDPWRPTFALVDIDPGEKTTWDETLTLARLYRAAFEHLGVRAYPKLTGRRGIQAWIPIVPHKYTYEDTSAWIEKVSRAVGQMVPDLVSWEWSVKERKGRARLDYTQNQPIKTLVAPYAVRPAAGAPLSAPISWDELDDPDLRPNRWTIRNIVDRVRKVGDLFAPAQTDHQELPKV